MPARRAAAVMKDHLRLRRSGDLEADLARNFADDVVLVTDNSRLHGHDAIRKSAGRLREQLPGARIEFVTCQVEGEYALLVWRARSDRCAVDCGVDSFHIRNGRIVAQTIHYDLTKPADVAARGQDGRRTEEGPPG